MAEIQTVKIAIQSKPPWDWLINENLEFNKKVFASTIG